MEQFRDIVGDMVREKIAKVQELCFQELEITRTGKRDESIKELYKEVGRQID